MTMAIAMRATGKMTSVTVLALLAIVQVMYMMVNGSGGKDRVTESCTSRQVILT